VAQDRRVGIAGHLHQLATLAQPPGAAVGRAGRLLGQHVQQIVDADLRGGGGEEDGDHVAAVHGLDEAAAQPLQIEGAAGQVALELGVVDLHRRLQDLAVGLGHRAEVGLARLEVEAVDDVGTRPWWAG
jgi:hypothetical protein